MNRLSKQEALQIWHERQQRQLSFIAMILDNRDYNHNVHDVKGFKTSKIQATDGNYALNFFLTDDSLVFADSDLVLTLDELAFWLDS